MSTDELEPIEPGLAQMLQPAREIEPVTEARRDRVRKRLEADIGRLDDRTLRRHRWLVGVVLAAAAAVAAILWVAERGRTGADTGSAQSIADRRTVRTGGRSIAVLEPGSEISWAVDDDGATVDQARGRVFYRVEPGGPFLVRTPSAEVQVTGTSFEVEIVMSNQKQRLKSMSLGAAFAAVTVVTVYEGGVVLANERGSTEVSAGHTAHADAAHAPSSTRSRIPAIAATGSARRESSVRPPAGDRVLVADLRARVRELEAELETVRDSAEADGDNTQERIEFAQRVYNPSPEQLREAAENCELSFAVPALLESGTYLTDATADKLALSSEERQAMSRALEDASIRWKEQMRAIYVDATGDENGADALSFDAMRAEVLNKSVPDDLLESRQRVAKERAGMLEAPAAGEGSPVERYYRYEIQRTTDAYAVVADAVGDDRAYEVLGSLPTNMSNYRDCRDK